MRLCLLESYCFADVYTPTGKNIARPFTNPDAGVDLVTVDSSHGVSRESSLTPSIEIAQVLSDHSSDNALPVQLGATTGRASYVARARGRTRGRMTQVIN